MILALAAVGLVGSQAIKQFNIRLSDSLLAEHPRASVEFVDLPEGMMALAGGDLRGSIADLLERTWTDPELCELIANRLSNVGWIDRVEAVERGRTGRFSVKARYRIPMALVNAGKDDYVLVDGQGIRLPGLYIYHDRWYVIEGVRGEPPGVGQPWTSPDLSAGLAILELMRPEPFRPQIVGVDVSNFGGRKNARQTHVVLKTDRRGTIRWGSAPGYEVEENLAAQKLAILRQNHLQTGRADAGHNTIDISTFPDKFHVPI